MLKYGGTRVSARDKDPDLTKSRMGRMVLKCVHYQDIKSCYDKMIARFC